LGAIVAFGCAPSRASPAVALAGPDLKGKGIAEQFEPERALEDVGEALRFVSRRAEAQQLILNLQTAKFSNRNQQSARCGAKLIHSDRADAFSSGMIFSGVRENRWEHWTK